MIINDRLRQLREEKRLSQGDIEKRTGLLRCYISRLENGHTIPSLETLEKLARSFEVPLYQLFYDGGAPPDVPKLLKRKATDGTAWGSTGKDSVYMHKLVKCLSRTNEFDRKLVFAVAQKVSAERGRRVSKEK
jgi:transcriptional regulator with XRE-family HTH domain